MTDTQTIWVARPVHPASYEPGEDLRPILARNILDQVLIASQATFSHYASDIFHDYYWLSQHVKIPDDGGIVFGAWKCYWAHDRWGTCIGMDRDVVSQDRKDGLYSIHVPPPVKGRVDAYVSKEDV